MFSNNGSQRLNAPDLDQGLWDIRIQESKYSVQESALRSSAQEQRSGVSAQESMFRSQESRVGIYGERWEQHPTFNITKNDIPPLADSQCTIRSSPRIHTEYARRKKAFEQIAQRSRASGGRSGGSRKSESEAPAECWDNDDDDEHDDDHMSTTREALFLAPDFESGSG